MKTKNCVFTFILILEGERFCLSEVDNGSFFCFTFCELPDKIDSGTDDY